MGGQKEDLYCNFSRKDLQGLCKKYGLPANKSNSEMATSLILYLEKKNLNSRIIWEATRSDHFSLETSEPQTGRRISSAGDRRKDIRGTMSSSGSGNNQCKIHDVQQHDLQNCKDPATSDKASEDVGILSQFHRDSNSSAGLLENTFSGVVRSPVQAPPPHFQFDVSSEDGIQLFVDLNSSPSEWIESLKDGVHVCSDMHKLESPSVHHEIGWLCCSKQMKGSLVDSYEKVDNGDVEEGSHPITKSVGAMPQSNELNGVEGSLSSPGCNPCNTVHSLENFGEEQATSSFRLESGIDKQVCGAKFCIREGIMPADPNTDIVPQVRTCNISFGCSLSSDPKCSRTLENQILNVDNDMHNHPSLQQMYGPPDPVVLCTGLSAPPDPVVVCTGLSASTSMEIRASSNNTLDQDRVGECLDFACHPQDTGIEHCGLTKSVPSPKSVCEMQPVEAVDHTKSASSSALVNGHSSDPTHLKQDKVEIGHNKASTSSESSGQILEAPKHLASNQINGTSLSPYHDYESRGDVNLTNSIETENGFMLRPHEAAQEAVEMHSALVAVQRKDASLSSTSNGGSLHFVVPGQNGAGHCTSPDSNELDKDIQKSQPTSMENLGKVTAGDQRKISECLDFRDSMRDTCRKSSGSEPIRDLKRKRQVNSTEGRSQSVKPDAKIPRITRQFAGNIHVSRRRSSRLFTKVASFGGKHTRKQKE